MDILELKSILLSEFLQVEIYKLIGVASCEGNVVAIWAKLNDFRIYISTESTFELIAIVNRCKFLIRAQLFRMLLDLAKHISPEHIH